MVTQDDCGYAADSPAKRRQCVRRAPPRYSQKTSTKVKKKTTWINIVKSTKQVEWIRTNISRKLRL